MRISWNVKDEAAGAVADKAAAYREAGIGAVHISPDRGDIDSWLANQQRLAEALIG